MSSHRDSASTSWSFPERQSVEIYRELLHLALKLSQNFCRVSQWPWSSFSTNQQKKILGNRSEIQNSLFIFSMFKIFYTNIWRHFVYSRTLSHREAFKPVIRDQGEMDSKCYSGISVKLQLLQRAEDIEAKRSAPQPICEFLRCQQRLWVGVEEEGFAFSSARFSPSYLGGVWYETVIDGLDMCNQQGHCS